MDMGYQRAFVVMVSIFAGAAVLFESNERMLLGIFIIPPGIIALLAYVSYQFRITAILHGHLESLEKKMNEQLKEDVHMWHSALVEVFMAHNNTINNYMMIPMLIFIIIITIFCLICTRRAMMNIPVSSLFKNIIFVTYWIAMGIGVFIVLPPFLENTQIRYASSQDEKVKEKYEYYMNARIEGFKYEAVKETKKKKNG